VRYRVDPRAVKVVEMKDGTQYPVSRAGLVHVDRSDHVREMEKGASRFHDFGAASVERLALTGFGAGKTCLCGFNAWPWQRKCPKCGASL
jgi:hypothetical protein